MRLYVADETMQQAWVQASRDDFVALHAELRQYGHAAQLLRDRMGSFIAEMGPGIHGRLRVSSAELSILNDIAETI